MHVGIDARLPAFRTGGISEYVTELIAALGRIDHETRYTIFHAHHDTATRIPVGAPNMARADLVTPCHHRYERLLLAAELRLFALDVFHSPDFIPPAAGGRRRVITVHDLHFLAAPEHLTAHARRYYVEQIDWAMMQADAIVTDSIVTREDVLRRFPAVADRIVTVPLAASAAFHERHDPAAVAATLKHFELSPGYVLFVGTIEPRKNLGMLLQAFDVLSARMEAAMTLVVVGRQGWRCDAEMRVLECGGPRLRWLGSVTQETLVHLYAGAALVAVPSWGEGFGLPLLEAMQSGCPVIASTGGALPETAGGAALLVDPLDREGWVDALARLLQDVPLRERIRQAGRERARQFSWSATAQAMRDVYRDGVV